MSTTVQGYHEVGSPPGLELDQQAIGVVVFGMSRSGTSAVTGMFAAAGFHVGIPDDLMPPSHANPRGYFERLDMYELNEEVLRSLGCTWFDPPSDRNQDEVSASVQPVLRRRLNAFFAQADGAPVAIKDPRIGILPGLWGDVLGEQLHPVLVIRDPIEIAYSLAQRDGTPIAFALSAWEIHMTSLLRYLSGRVVTVARYPDLVRDPDAPGVIVEGACEHLADDVAVRVRPGVAHTALTAALHHHSAFDGEVDQHLTGRQHELWDALRSLQAGARLIDPPEHLLRPSVAARLGTRGERDRLGLTARVVELEAVLAARVAELEARVAARDLELVERAWTLLERERVLAEVGQRGEQLEYELSIERERVADGLAMIHQLTQAHEVIEQSRSWRLTAPMRRMGSRSRRMRHRPSEWDQAA
jgi:hypothetical protein